jgi:glycosyltransferase involved in cell wall biosynthesis
MSLKILLVSDHYPPFIGGAHRQTHLLGQELHRRGHEVNVATVWSGGLAEEEDDNGVRVYRLRQLRTALRGLVRDRNQRHQPPFPDPITSFGLRQLIKRLRPDIVHAYGWMSYSAAVALSGSNIPLLLSARDYGYSCATRTLVQQGRVTCTGPGLAKCLSCAADLYGAPKGWVAALSVLWGRTLLRHKINGLHSISSYVQDINRRDFLKCSGSRPTDVVTEVLIPSFREDDGHRRYSDDPRIRKYVEQLPADNYILYVGALRQVKGVNQLLDAYRRLSSPPPLVLIGTWEFDSPHEFPRGVSVLQNFPHDAVMAAWDRCLFGVIPSLWPEPLGSVVYEGMSRGKAVIGTTPGGHTDMIVSGETGLLVPAGDVPALAQAMTHLIEQPALREHFGRAARERAGLFTASLAVPQFERVYQALIDRASGAMAPGVDLEIADQIRSSRG